MSGKVYTEEFFKKAGAKGGKAVKGAKKRRGSKAHYAELGRKSAAARKKK